MQKTTTDNDNDDDSEGKKKKHQIDNWREINVVQNIENAIERNNKVDI